MKHRFFTVAIVLSVCSGVTHATEPQHVVAPGEDPIHRVTVNDRVPLDTSLTWVETPAGRPVINRGPEGAWDHHAVDNPFVLVRGDAFCCFYEAQDKPFDQGGHERIGLALSRDGIHWRKAEHNPILDVGRPGAWDSVVAKLPTVIRHGETFYMFYSGRDGRTKQIGLATSSDLVHWKKEPSNPVLRSRSERWDKFLSTHPAPIFRRGKRFYLLYRGMTRRYKNQGMGLATSPDLVHWTRVQDAPVIPAQEELASMAAVETANRFVGISQSAGRPCWFSKDLVTWKKGNAAKFTGPNVATVSNPYLVGGQWNILYEQQDRIYRAVLTQRRSVRSQ